MQSADAGNGGKSPSVAADAVRSPVQHASRYITWMREQGHPVFVGAGIEWRLYERALVPARPFPTYVEVSMTDARRLLRESRAPLIRWATGPSPLPTEWWHMVCSGYSSGAPSKMARRKTRRGHRLHSVRSVDSLWLAVRGYDCYRSAFARYRGLKPAAEDEFRAEMTAYASGPFEHWCVFSDDRLVGYATCLVDPPLVAELTTRLDPAALPDMSAYALEDAILSHYVRDCGMVISNGARNISHATTRQEWSAHFGYSRCYASLHVVYQPWLAPLVRCGMHVRGAIGLLPDYGRIRALKALLYQEELRRACAAVDR